MNINLITIEGMDYTGKTTLQKNLIPELEKLYKDRYSKIIPIKFPYYDSNTGKLILDYLNSNNKANDDRIDYRYITSLFTLNRLEFFRDNKDNLDKDALYVADRYTLSNIIHHLSNQYGGPSTINIAEVGYADINLKITQEIETLIKIEYKYLELPIPKYTLFLTPENLDLIYKHRSLRNDNIDKLEQDDRLKKAYEFSKSNLIYFTMSNECKKYGSVLTRINVSSDYELTLFSAHTRLKNIEDFYNSEKGKLWKERIK